LHPKAATPKLEPPKLEPPKLEPPKLEPWDRTGPAWCLYLLTDSLDRPKSARMFAVPKIRRADSGVLSTN
jgi:hypothetical protein